RQAVADAAAANPGSHFVLVGASVSRLDRPNLVGVVLLDDQAAYLGGLAAGFDALDEGGSSPRVAWVGPGSVALVQAFRRGVHRAEARTTILLSPSSSRPADCKEAALDALMRGAVALVARGGLCAEAVASAAHAQNRVAAAVSDFELPEVAVAGLVRNAVAGSYS